MGKMDDVIAQFSGKSADQIAAMVRRRGIKGRMGTTYGCPMALLLDGAFTGEYVIGRRYIVRRCGGQIDKVRTPEAVAQFVRKFDIGGYPELVAPPPRCIAKSKRPPRNRSLRGERTRPPIKNHISKLVNRFHDTDAA